MKTTLRLALLSLSLLVAPAARAQVGIGTPTPDASAALDVKATNKGLLPPRLTSVQRDAITSPAAGLTIYNTDAGKLNTWNGFYWAEPVQSLPASGPQTVTFNFTGTTQTWTVPPNVTSVQVDMAGARGRTIDNCSNCYRGGRGGRVQATLAVTPGQVLTIEVGGDRGYNPSTLYQDGGYNGGGRGSEPGGGATDIRIGGTALTNRVLVAGGGGGSGYYARGGPGGGLAGGDGLVPTAGNPTGVPATGGTQTAGGTNGGTPQQYCYCGSSPAGPGVAAGLTGGTSWGAAGGGGGYYGGGMSHGNAGAGGGSSYTDPTLATNVSHTQGYQNGAGYARLTFSFQPEAPAISLNNTTTSQAAGGVIFSDGAKLAGNTGQLYWDNAGTRLGVGTSSPQAKLHVAGAARIDGLAGTGTRMVTTDASGTLVAQALPTDAQTLSLSGQGLSISGGNSITLPNGADNLGNHTATQNLNLGTYQLVGNGGSTGLGLSSTGGLLLPGVIQRAGAPITSTSDLGLYSRQNGAYLRLVTNNAPIRFYADDDAGTTPTVSIEANGSVGIGTGNALPQNRLDVQTTAGRIGAHASGRPLYVTGDFNEAAGGAEFRHYNGTQGVGIGYNSLYAAGSNADQSLNLMPKGAGGVGIGTTSPAALLDVNGSELVRGNLSFGAATRQMIGLWNTNYGIGIQTGTQYFRSGEAFAWYVGGAHSDNQFDAGGGSQQMILKDGRLGIGTGFSNAALPNGPLEIRQASPYLVVHSPGNAWASFGLDAGDNYKLKLNDGPGFSGTNYMTFSGTNVGIGTTAPSFPLDVQRVVTPGNYNYGYLNGGGQVNYATNNTGPVSIRATGRVLATEFNATSDRRLKTVIGLSDRAADLALLQKIRITDYTMRDRAQYGARQFKKVIAQEVEEIFPQAVSQHVGFLPDVYAVASEVRSEGDSLLVLMLPNALPEAAKAGQRVKLIGEQKELTAIVARAASASTLVVRGAKELASQKVFVFGLEHADVRTVDYEALAMLNVSATQELARKVAALEQQNAALRQQTQQQTCRLDEQQAALQTLQTQATAETASLAERLKALENLLGTKAEATR
ncbi:tail fiber domain-containing protein [Hymenobacter sp. ASUV-10]|uniref:receptor protein-tyrosine kinase n=1 Tax=Hymenobacter aranciens TaxID=3063996 RepID=A0ABT9BGN0_9BACT|nr:tail fiber domain-containing protein [Hymenobacter sp. ASUV-10]MDO7877427.1 tail fiber domain-containing protein [Hymenobacter sp. ASUV-10]